MPTKTITITLEAYERLKREKRKGESFSDVIIRLTEKKKDLLEFAGKWKDSGDEIEKIILESRKELGRHVLSRNDVSH